MVEVTVNVKIRVSAHIHSSVGRLFFLVIYTLRLNANPYLLWKNMMQRSKKRNKLKQYK